MYDADVVIVGAGPAGLSCACSLANIGLHVIVVEKLAAEVLADPPIDGRDIALTHLSRNNLSRLGVWDRIAEEEVSLIRAAKVLDGNSPYALLFDHRKVADDALGYLVPNYIIRKAVHEAARALSHVEIISNVKAGAVCSDVDGASITLSNGQTLRSRLLIAADSRFSELRRKMGISASMLDFGRVVIVCRMQHESDHQGIAYECFNYAETLAVLPLGGPWSEKLSSIVITLPTSRSEQILNMHPVAFNSRVQKHFGNRLGRMELVGERYPYPLVAVHANRFTARRFALIGDAAVGMHPVTAHGFNLGLRSQDTLTRAVKKSLERGKEWASTRVLDSYQWQHRRITLPLYLGTNALVSLYTDDRPLHKLMRSAVLRAGNMLPPVKQAIVNQLTETH